jgi:hypothetical protein
MARQPKFDGRKIVSQPAQLQDNCPMALRVQKFFPIVWMANHFFVKKFANAAML